MRLMYYLPTHCTCICVSLLTLFLAVRCLHCFSCRSTVIIFSQSIPSVYNAKVMVVSQKEKKVNKGYVYMTRRDIQQSLEHEVAASFVGEEGEV
jgi:hypothetical protein